MSTAGLKLFSPLKTPTLTFRNRFMRSPVNMSDSNKDGMPNQSKLDHITKMAESQTGLIVPGYVYHMKSGKAASLQTGWTTDAHAEAWRPVIEKAHENGSKIVFQVCHGGAACNPEDTGGEVVGASPLRPGQREMTIAEIEEVVHEYRKAAIRCKKVGADGIMLHAAHGYLISAFLSPVLNHRTDKYGGSLENRARLLWEICNEIKDLTGPEFILAMKINGDDCVDGGLNTNDLVSVLKSLPKVDLAEVSCGIINAATIIRSRFNAKKLSKELPQSIAEFVKSVEARADKRYPLREGYNLEFARKVKQALPSLTVASVGGFRTVKAMEEALQSGSCDLVSMGRPFLREPDLVKKLAEGKADSVECVSCGRCILFGHIAPPCRCYLKEGFLPK